MRMRRNSEFYRPFTFGRRFAGFLREPAQAAVRLSAPATTRAVERLCPGHPSSTGKALPLEPLVPNAETMEAMKAARRGDVVTAGKPSNLLASLNRDC
jgi:hypothetical protein